MRSLASFFLRPQLGSASAVFIRLAVGLIFFTQGILKYTNPNMGVFRFTRIGFSHPYFTAHFVGAFEITCGLLVLAGLWTRLAAVPLLVVISTAIATTKIPELFRSSQGFWYMVSDARTDFAVFCCLLFLIVSGGAHGPSTQNMPAAPELKTEALAQATHGRLRELSLLYLRLGTTAFGGPAAHIAMMEDEVVRRRHWLTREEFLDLLGVINLIPGPNSTEMAIQIGYRIAGWPGLLMGGVCFILPAAVLTLALAWVYVRYGALPQAASVLYGIKAVMIAVVLQAIWNLSSTAIKSRLLMLIGAVAVVANALGVNVLLVLFGAGIAAIIAKRAASELKRISPAAMTLPVSGRVPGTLVGALGAGAPFGLVPLFTFFLKVGAVLFGSGYVLLAFLRTDLVVRLHWLSDKQLLDAIAVGQVTPGPVFSTATFIGYLLGRIPGAVVATVGIFLPSFFFIAIIGPLVPHMRKSAILATFLDGVNVGALALMLVVTWHLGRAALVDLTTIALAVLSAVALMRFKINSTWLILTGGIIGYVGQRFLA